MVNDRAVYGPMSRSELEALLEKGRVKLSDQVSISNGPWQPITGFLAQPAADPAPRENPWREVAAPAHHVVPPTKTLRVLCGNKIFGPMTHEQVGQLVFGGRVKPTDLICAINGPWMPVSDYLTSLAPSAGPTAASPDEKSPQSAGAVPLYIDPLNSTARPKNVSGGLDVQSNVHSGSARPPASPARQGGASGATHCTRRTARDRGAGSSCAGAQQPATTSPSQPAAPAAAPVSNDYFVLEIDAQDTLAAEQGVDDANARGTHFFAPAAGAERRNRRITQLPRQARPSRLD